MQTKLHLEMFIEHEQQGMYLFLPFSMPENVETLKLRYDYPRYTGSETAAGKGRFTSRQEVNIIDLGMIAPDGRQVGASGSDKREITIDGVRATPGYRATPLEQGEWKILVGAYKVAAGGVRVNYELTFTYKHRRWLKGDLHTHTHASDGVLTAEELAWRAVRHGLDYLAITDHNQMTSQDSLPEIPGLTLIPGVEWTHFNGHANFLGVDRPYDEPFAANTPEEILGRFTSARKRGASITINHPFDEVAGFKLDMQNLPYDNLEIWNGPMRESNLRSVGLWQSLLSAGRKVAICGGSDYHRDTPFLFLGGPTTCVYASSASPQDILGALNAGHAYITFAPNGPWLEFTAGEAILGDSLPWTEGMQVDIRAGGLITGDVVRLVSGTGSEVLMQAPTPGDFDAAYPIAAPGFVRVEILRAFLPGIPMLPALISNPIYFTEG